MLKINKIGSLIGVYIFALFFAFQVALPSFINSSFLDTFFPEKFLGLIYTLSSLIIICLFFIIPYILKKFGNYKTIFFLILLEIASLGFLAFSQNTFLLISFFVLSLIAISFIYFSLDIFIEGMSADADTGKIRGIYLTLMNLVWVFAPLINGVILKNGDYWKIYLLAMILLLPTLFILNFNLKNFKDTEYRAVPFLDTLAEVWQNKNIIKIFGATFLLNFFYSWMTIYTPIYLHKYMNFSWSEIGLIFGIMLLPFVFFQFLFGHLADERWGEKEILSFGFVIMALATILLFFIPANSSLWLWAGLLFSTRIGASAVEVMVDTYFFKKVDTRNANIIGFFRIARPLAYMLGSLSLSLFFCLVNPASGLLYIILGVIMFFGLFSSLTLEDTK